MQEIEENKILILIAGMCGVGKSTILGEFKKRATCIGVENEVQHKAARLAGYTNDDIYGWGDKWEKTNHESNITEEHVKTSFSEAIESKERKIIILEGSILVLEKKFLQPIIKILEPVETHKFILKLEAEKISEQIKKRGIQNQQKKAEDLKYINQHQDGYISLASKDWETFTSYAELKDKINSLIA